jgi:hypothetical protein
VVNGKGQFIINANHFLQQHDWKERERIPVLNSDLGIDRCNEKIQELAPPCLIIF